MNATLTDLIRNSTAHRKPRDTNKDFVLEHRETVPDLVAFAFNISDKDSHKACWILELIAEEQIELLKPHLDFIIQNLCKVNDESSIRCISKVCQFLVTAHFAKNQNGIILSENHLQQITEACFDWLINDTKVAAKAYSMRTLFVLGKHFDWIHPELFDIINKDYEFHSAAYKAVAREVLKKINRAS